MTSIIPVPMCFHDDMDRVLAMSLQWDFHEAIRGARWVEACMPQIVFEVEVLKKLDIRIRQRTWV